MTNSSISTERNRKAHIKNMDHQRDCSQLFYVFSLFLSLVSFLSLLQNMIPPPTMHGCKYEDIFEINHGRGVRRTSSALVVTTRVDDVAIWACRNDRKCVYRMKPLKELHSRMLFFNRVFGSEDGCPPQFKEVSAEILKKCGGLPLAIITIASLLASRQVRSKDEWESIRNSLGSKFATNPTLEEMRIILNLSYIHLPLHLCPCLLYLGMYPEDKEIRRRDLVLQWVAEGFVKSSHGLDLEDVAESYFNELINRSLI